MKRSDFLKAVPGLAALGAWLGPKANPVVLNRVVIDNTNTTWTWPGRAARRVIINPTDDHGGCARQWRDYSEGMN